MEPINVILYFSHDYIFIRVLRVGHTWQYSLTETKKSTKKIEYLRNTLTNEESYRRQLARIYLLISFVLGLFYSVSEDGCSIDRYCSYFFFTIIYFIFTSSCTIVDPCVDLIRKIRTPVAATYPTRDRLMAPAPPPPCLILDSLSLSLFLSHTTLELGTENTRMRHQNSFYSRFTFRSYALTAIAHRAQRAHTDQVITG